MTRNEIKVAIITIICTLIAVVFAVAIAMSNDKRTPALVEEIPPEQSHYAVFYIVCGALQHILMTTNPPLLQTMRMMPSQEMLDLLEATPEERIVELRYVGPECYYANPHRKHPEPI